MLHKLHPKGEPLGDLNPPAPRLERLLKEGLPLVDGIGHDDLVHPVQLRIDLPALHQPKDLLFCARRGPAEGAAQAGEGDGGKGREELGEAALNDQAGEARDVLV